jgi:sec-independent protein translocase protein TatC
MSAPPSAPETRTGKKSRRFSPRRYLGALRKVVRNRLNNREQGEMTVLDHLEILRGRVLKALLALILTTIISFAFSGQLVRLLSQPIGGMEVLRSVDITENISVFMRVAILGGVILGFPFIIYQIVAFIAPGLNNREKLWLYTLVPSATLLFIGGVLFAWFVMMPVSLQFLINFLGIQTDPRPSSYFSFLTSFLFWVGVCFEMPLVIFFLAKLKFVTARQLVRGWRFAFMGIATLAAVVTPTVDPVNMTIVAIPLIGLYIIGIFLAWIA